MFKMTSCDVALVRLFGDRLEEKRCDGRGLVSSGETVSSVDGVLLIQSKDDDRCLDG